VNTDDAFDSSSETIVLYPENGGNLHCFTALTPCAVLDVMGPPYNRTDGRDCAYYSEAPYSSSCGEFVSLIQCAVVVESHVREGGVW
jgi:plant cysteine oxidase